MLFAVALSAGVCAGCSDPGDETKICDVSVRGEGGVAEVGLAGTNDVFTPITEGQEIQVELGLQGLYMFVMNTRVRGMRIGPEEQGAISIHARADTGDVVFSLEVGCREREFVDGPEGAVLASPFWVAIDPSYYSTFDGTPVRLQTIVRDADGIEAMDERRVIARMPPR